MILSIRKKQVIFILCYLFICAVVKVANAQDIKVAVASNFLQPMKSLTRLYEKETGQRVKISSGSTGKFYTQIIHGAPYDLFFAANTREPERLEKRGYAIHGSRMTYAVGKIILWSKKHDVRDQSEIKSILTETSIKTIAIANPKTAPYGVAAMEVIHQLNISLQVIRVIKGENINQTWQFLQTGNVDMGFIAASQIKDPDKIQGGYYLNIPINLYTAIEQQAVILSSSKKVTLAKKFLIFIQREDIKQRIAKYGYYFVNNAAVVMR